MKKLLVIILVVFSGLSLSAQEKGYIYFLRLNDMGSKLVGNNFGVINGEKVSKLGYNNYSWHEVPVGKHTIAVQGRRDQTRSEALELNVEAGKTYYINVFRRDIEAIGFGPRFQLFPLEVSEESANMIFPLLTQSEEYRQHPVITDDNEEYIPVL
ncbi:MAG: DUF2846 domain-containing protein [Bacteroidota bacterium]